MKQRYLPMADMKRCLAAVSDFARAHCSWEENEYFVHFLIAIKPSGPLPSGGLAPLAETMACFRLAGMKRPEKGGHGPQRVLVSVGIHSLTVVEVEREEWGSLAP